MSEVLSGAQELRRAEEITEAVDALEAEGGVAPGSVERAEAEHADAVEEVAEAEQTASDLEGRLDDGDLDVTQGELEAAQGRAGFLRRRLRGFELRVQAAREAQRMAQVADLTDEVAAFADDASLDGLRGWYAQTVLAGSTLRDLLEQREQRRVALTVQADALDAPHLKRSLQQLQAEPLLEALSQEIAKGAWPGNPWLRPHALHDPSVVAEQQELHRQAQERAAVRQAEQVAAAEAERAARLAPGAVEPADAPMYRLRGA